MARCRRLRSQVPMIALATRRWPSPDAPPCADERAIISVKPVLTTAILRQSTAEFQHLKTSRLVKAIHLDVSQLADVLNSRNRQPEVVRRTTSLAE